MRNIFFTSHPILAAPQPNGARNGAAMYRLDPSHEPNALLTRFRSGTGAGSAATGTCPPPIQPTMEAGSLQLDGMHDMIQKIRREQ